MKFLVFGFSVTAEDDGYVARATALRAATHTDDEIVKVAIGGLQPGQARHLIRDIVDRHRPDALIIEIATTAYRLRPGTAAQIADHVAGMVAYFAICRARDMRCGILDLPLTGVVEDTDWMTRTNAALSRSHHVPHRVVALAAGTLRDNVHPNDRGRDLYAHALADLLATVHATESNFSDLEPERSFDAVAVRELNVPGAVWRDFARDGFSDRMLMIDAGKTVRISLPRPLRVTGLIARMAPTSGTLTVRRGPAEDRVHCYDRFCYYERVTGKPLKPVITDHLAVFQDPALPPDDLLKGRRDNGPRWGGITHILYENTVPDHRAVPER